MSRTLGVASASGLILSAASGEGGLGVLAMWRRTPHPTPVCSSREKHGGNLGFQAFSWLWSCWMNVNGDGMSVTAVPEQGESLSIPQGPGTGG